MAYMAEIVTTVASTPATFEVETAAGNNNFDIISNWTPSQVRISINDNGDGSFVDILSVGNLPLQITGYSYSDPQPPKHYIYSIDRSSYLYFKENSSGYGSSGYVRMYYDGDSHAVYSWSTGSEPGQYVHLAGYYSAKHERFYIAYAFVGRLLENVTGFRVITISDPDLIEGYKRIFYGIPAPETIKIKRENPVSPFFEYGQASILQYGIYSEDLRLADAIPTVDEFDAREGWSFDNSSKVLRYISGSNNQPVEVDGVYNGISYNLRDVFTPPTGSQPYNPGGNSSQGGGGGSFGQGENSVDVTGGTPTGSFEGNSSATGMFTSYVCSSSQLNLYADWLWGSSAGLAIARSVIDRLFGSPDNALIELTSYPFNIALIGAGLQDTTIFWGNFNSGVAGRALTRPYGQIDWGKVQLTEFWGNFLDYAPHTKVELYLPFGTGFVELDPGQVLPGTISIKTNIDLTKGTCVHIVTATQLLNGVAQTPTIIGCFEGTPGKNLPMTSSDWSSKLGGNVVNAAGLAAFGMIAGGVSPVASKGFAIPTATPPGLPGGTTGVGAGTGLVPATYDFDAPVSGWTMVETRPAIPGFVFKGASEVAAATSKAINKTPPHISRNGGFSSSAAGMMVNYPYVIISRPKQSVPEQYGHHYGYPSNIYQNLAFLSGYTEIGSIHYDGMDCTSTELAELDRILKGGVIF